MESVWLPPFFSVSGHLHFAWVPSLMLSSLSLRYTFPGNTLSSWWISFFSFIHFISCLFYIGVVCVRERETLFSRLLKFKGIELAAGMEIRYRYSPPPTSSSFSSSSCLLPPLPHHHRHAAAHEVKRNLESRTFCHLSYFALIRALLPHILFLLLLWFFFLF